MAQYLDDFLGSSLLCCFGSRAVFESMTAFAGLDDMEVACEPVEQGGCHLRITEDVGPFCEAEVRCDR